MKAITQEFINELVTKFGGQVDIKANPGIVAEIIKMAEGRPDIYQSFEAGRIASYDKTYTRDYEKDGYDKRYGQYDKTVDPGRAAQVIREMRPELEKLVNVYITKLMEEPTPKK